MEPLKPHTTEYHHVNAYWMARLSKEVYKETSDDDRPDKQKILASLKMDDDRFVRVDSFNNKSTQAMVVEHEEYIAVVFRGTDEKTDFKNNLKLSKTKKLFGRFHHGFYRAVQNVWPKIQTTVTEITATNPLPVWLTGHSLGGALAVIATAIRMHEDKPFSGLYTFGQPRCMNRKTRDTFETKATGRYFRFKNNKDSVAALPSYLMGYRHGGQCIYISGEKKLYKAPVFLPNTSDGAKIFWGEVAKSGIHHVKDHKIDSYLDAIKDWGDNPLLSTG